MVTEKPRTITTALQAYQEHISRKIKLVERSGFEITPEDFHQSSHQYPHQFVCGRWALSRGRAMLALACGLHKTRIQLQMMQCVHRHTGGKTLIVVPLGAKQQFTVEDGPAIGMDVRYVTNDAEALAANTPYLLTNYERVRDGNLSAAFIAEHIVGVTLDEGDVLRSLGSKTYEVFTKIFTPVTYRFVATATPDPNGYLEMVNYAVFLGVGEKSTILNKYFGRNVDEAGDLQLYPHREEEFWLWVASWCLFLTKPSDLGFSDEGFVLPEHEIIWHRIPSDHTRAWEMVDNRGQASLLLDSAKGISAAMKEKRYSLNARVAKAAELVAEEPEKHWLLWHDLEDERRAILNAIPNVVDVYGSQDAAVKEERLLAFAHGQIQNLATKPEIAGAGNNFQHFCHRNVVVGVGYKFKDFYQLLHRTDRFGQKHKVVTHVIHTDAEDTVANVLQRKWQQHEHQVEKMTAIVKRYGLVDEAIAGELRRTLGVNRQVAKGEFFTAVNNDCVLEAMSMADNSIDHILTSIPFSNHYGYVNAQEDFGHNESDEAFFEQMDFLTPQLFRVLKPGRVAAIHVKDLLRYGHASPSGILEVIPFSDDTVRHFRKHGFAYEGRITVVTDVVRENSTTYRLGWTEQCKDGSKMGVGMPEYVLLFRKPPTDRSNAYADEPVVKDKEDYSRMRWQVDAHQFWRSDGNRILSPEEIAGMKTSDVFRWYKNFSLSHIYNHEGHVALGEPVEANGHLPSGFMLFPPQSWSPWVWTDVNFMRTLNGEQSRKRLENHVCPFAFDVVDRLIRRYTNPDELVYDPFGGLMTTVYRAIVLGRRGYASELNADYWRWGTKYCQGAEIKRAAPTLFDLLEYEDDNNSDEFSSEPSAALATAA